LNRWSWSGAAPRGANPPAFAPSDSRVASGAFLSVPGSVSCSLTIRTRSLEEGWVMSSGCSWSGHRDPFGVPELHHSGGGGEPKISVGFTGGVVGIFPIATPGGGVMTCDQQRTIFLSLICLPGGLACRVRRVTREPRACRLRQGGGGWGPHGPVATTSSSVFRNETSTEGFDPGSEWMLVLGLYTCKLNAIEA
jgi:hypothetical protein